MTRRLSGVFKLLLEVCDDFDGLTTGLLVHQPHQVLGSFQMIGLQIQSLEPGLLRLIKPTEAVKSCSSICDSLSVTRAQSVKGYNQYILHDCLWKTYLGSSVLM
jgi:hypothetical protein